MYDFENDIWLCHSFDGMCFNFTAFQPAVNVLREIQVFLENNKDEVVTIIIEDYVKSPKGLTKVFNAAGLQKFMFPVTRMPKNGGDWPALDDMIQQNQRLLVFTSDRSKEATEGIAYQWKYMVENQYGNGGLKVGACPNRAQSAPMSDKSKSLVLVNHFPDAPDLVVACRQNSAPLLESIKACYQAAGQRWPNFIAVDFYKRSDGGGAPQAVDVSNGNLICGCDNFAACKCPGYCAWPFHQPLYGPQAPPLIAPNGDVGVDGMIINLATLLVNTVTNQEAVSTCTGMFGSGAYPGYPGRVLVDKTTGASYNALGLAGRKYLLPAMWDPQTSKCKTLV
ncbi:hypothetical protein F2Q70_00038133 [Brassica cretica]|uniref:PI-PLC X domain-containing protein n=1 Tax=Brassica cretica TaxID=69181 RepID=A0A8S9K8T5_BRACR|nr:hypothetical protein F2Q70_00038133 [Brassica cretica]